MTEPQKTLEEAINISNKLREAFSDGGEEAAIDFIVSILTHTYKIGGTKPTISQDDAALIKEKSIIIKKALEFGRDSYPKDSGGERMYLNALEALDIIKEASDQ